MTPNPDYTPQDLTKYLMGVAMRVVNIENRLDAMQLNLNKAMAEVDTMYTLWGQDTRPEVSVEYLATHNDHTARLASIEQTLSVLYDKVDQTLLQVDDPPVRGGVADPLNVYEFTNRLASIEQTLNTLQTKVGQTLLLVDTLPDAWGEELLQVQSLITDLQLRVKIVEMCQPKDYIQTVQRNTQTQQ